MECEAQKACKNCNELRLMLEQERNERMQLINLITAKPTTAEEKEVNWEEIRPSQMPWHARRNQLEQQAFNEARQVNEK